MGYEAHLFLERLTLGQTNQIVVDHLRIPQQSSRYAGSVTSSLSNYRTNSFASSTREPLVPRPQPPDSHSLQYTNHERRRSRFMFPGASSSTAPVNHDLALDSILSAYEDPFTVPADRSPYPSVAETRFSAATGTNSKRKSSKRMMLWIICLLSMAVIIAAAIFPIYFFIIKPRISRTDSIGSNNGSGNTTSNTPDVNNSTVDTPHSAPNRSDPSSLGIPPSAVGTVLDSTKWLDWTDFNLTYTNATVGGLSLMVYLVSRTCD